MDPRADEIKGVAARPDIYKAPLLPPLVGVASVFTFTSSEGWMKGMLKKKKWLKNSLKPHIRVL
jgi:hypothetical protein